MILGKINETKILEILGFAGEGLALGIIVFFSGTKWNIFLILMEIRLPITEKIFDFFLDYRYYYYDFFFFISWGLIWIKDDIDWWQFTIFICLERYFIIYKKK